MHPSLSLSYLCILLFHLLQSLHYIYIQNELVSCSIRHFPHKEKLTRGPYTRRYLYILCHPQCILLDRNKSNRRWCWCSIRIHHTVGTKWEKKNCIWGKSNCVLSFVNMLYRASESKALTLHSLSSGMLQPLPPYPSLQWHWPFKQAPCLHSRPVVYRQSSGILIISINCRP